MPTLLLLIISFVVGFVAAKYVVFRRKRKIAQDIDASLKKDATTPMSSAPTFTTETDIETVKADAIEKKILYEEELSLIFRMGKEMFSSMSIENIAKVIVENATSLTNTAISTLLLEDKETAEFVPVYSKGIQKEFLDKMRFKKGESISGWVILNKEILVKYDMFFYFDDQEM